MKTYGLATVPALRILALPAMTLRDAEKARDILCNAGKPVVVVNLKAE